MNSNLRCGWAMASDVEFVDKENAPDRRIDSGHFRGLAKRCRRRPTLPRSRERSTIGAVGLNDRVRDGNECGPYALVASKSVIQRVDDLLGELQRSRGATCSGWQSEVV